MPKKPKLSKALRDQIILLHKQRLSQVKIAKTIKCSRCAVQNTISRYRRTRKYHNLPKSGRKLVTTVREDRLIERIALGDRHKSAIAISAELCAQRAAPISVHTVRRRLTAANLRARKPRHKPLLTELHRKQRFTWAKKYQHWTVDDWAKVRWSDESNIDVHSVSGASYVRRRSGEAF
ncbi:hypothetical protein AMK59_2318 [Oryctes borbonicus]|uniref:Transposase Tc1-like domain-containing protein n=1 Tax=Oryctes borbonicus TaxID=1629725 RepID=A0A0T6B9M6_9SCAR|nr:hypothetical protein AMK59_2318 [Oryctes borbonicus]